MDIMERGLGERQRWDLSVNIKNFFTIKALQNHWLGSFGNLKIHCSSYEAKCRALKTEVGHWEGDAFRRYIRRKMGKFRRKS